MQERRHKRFPSPRLAARLGGQNGDSRVDLYTAMGIGGWSSLRMVERYASVSAEHARAAMAKLDGLSRFCPTWPKMFLFRYRFLTRFVISELRGKLRSPGGSEKIYCVFRRLDGGRDRD
jgi:hypothetical protein